MSILYAFTGKIISDDTQGNTCAPLTNAADSLIVQSINTDDIRDLTKKNMDTAGTYTEQDYYLLDTQPDTLLWNEPLKVRSEERRVGKESTTRGTGQESRGRWRGVGSGANRDDS